jgi:hypothetical protein
MSRRDAEVANGSDLSNVKLDAAIDSVAQKIINSTEEGGRICWIHEILESKLTLRGISR